MPDREVLLQGERTEAEGFYSLIHHISEETKVSRGIFTTIVAGGPAWSSRVIDWNLFNRVIGLGLFDICTADDADTFAKVMFQSSGLPLLP